MLSFQLELENVVLLKGSIAQFEKSLPVCVTSVSPRRPASPVTLCKNPRRGPEPASQGAGDPLLSSTFVTSAGVGVLTRRALLGQHVRAPLQFLASPWSRTHDLLLRDRRTSCSVLRLVFAAGGRAVRALGEARERSEAGLPKGSQAPRCFPRPFCSKPVGLTLAPSFQLRPRGSGLCVLSQGSGHFVGVNVSAGPEGSGACLCWWRTVSLWPGACSFTGFP